LPLDADTPAAAMTLPLIAATPLIAIFRFSLILIFSIRCFHITPLILPHYRRRCRQPLI